MPQDDEDFEQLEEESMVFEPQIILDDHDDTFEEKQDIEENDVEMEEEEKGKFDFLEFSKSALTLQLPSPNSYAVLSLS